MTNQSQSPNVKTLYDLEERTAGFGERVIVFVKSFPVNEVTRPLIGQLVRSATSIGANYMEADAGESRKDFRQKIAICKKEAKETLHFGSGWSRKHTPSERRSVGSSGRRHTSSHSFSRPFYGPVGHMRPHPFELWALDFIRHLAFEL